MTDESRLPADDDHAWGDDLTPTAAKTSETNRRVKLKRHIGVTNRRGGGLVRSEVPQLRIFLDDAHVGYIGHQKGAPVCLITRLDAATIEEIHQRVGLMPDGSKRKVGLPPKREAVAEALLDNVLLDDLDDED